MTTQKTEELSLLSLFIEEFAEELEKLQPCVLVTSLKGSTAYLLADEIEENIAEYRQIANAEPCSPTCRCAEQANSIIAQLESNPDPVYVAMIRDQYMQFPISALATLKAEVQAYKAWRAQETKERPT